MFRHATSQWTIGLFCLGLLACDTSPAEAGGLFRRRERAVVPTVRPAPPAVTPTSAPFPTTLGSFYPTPYMTVRGNFPTGGGYSPGDTQGGDQSMDIYGPLSALRFTSAPVLTYTRGYDGRP